ncbi:hypothetical protein Rsub_10900 [Raphidocelis subcapitata]|uniref:Uncharacterized protein n=1 Tax=Raphidocelis subcapitata TaxID=307507 RepID=A0A2V0PD15_9CHLO|nr:hypothetical protein Rsub_10900 [Raphidocelis subcapitata]|eukprot:GBF97736.1 hypothetical protein Rsub_10900 [Raphidocelis subcapitata]
MPRVAALRRIAAAIAAPAAAHQQQQAALGALAAAASSSRGLSGLAAAGHGPWSPPRPGCGCAACCARRPLAAPHGPACACGACRGAAAPWAASAAVAAPARRHYRCCPGLDGQPPDRVNIEFDPEDVDTYIAIADAIEEAFPNIVVDGNAESDGRPGSFEVVGATGTVLFSRLAAVGASPQAAAIVAALEADGARGGEGGEGGACAVAPGGAAAAAAAGQRE